MALTIKVVIDNGQYSIDTHEDIKVLHSQEDRDLFSLTALRLRDTLREFKGISPHDVIDIRNHVLQDKRMYCMMCEKLAMNCTCDPLQKGKHLICK